MKKITFFILFLTTCLGFSQSWSTGTVTLDSDYTVKFDITTTTVTMTMIGPSNSWLGVAISNTTYGAGSSMGQFSGDDAITYNNSLLNDRFMPASNGTPNIDATQNWSISSDNVSGTTRTVIGTRARDTGDTNDYIFQTSEEVLTIVWAKGGANSNDSFGYHSGGRGATVAQTLSTPTFEAPTKFSIYPNPSSDVMNIKVPKLTDDGLNLEVYDVLGKKVHTQQLNNLSSKINIAKWNSGLYLVRLTSPNQDITLTKRFVKL